MDKKTLHIIAFDNPEPPTYGGIIDVFYKIKSLSGAGIEIILHIWEYGSGKKIEELENYCKEIHFYTRDTHWLSHLSIDPYIVRSRLSKRLEKRLEQDKHPILLEGLHSCGILRNKRLHNRTLILRAHNIEHHYYFHLAKNETSWINKSFFLLESLKLLFFEQKAELIKHILTVSKEDEKYFKEKYPQNNIIYLPSFQSNDKVVSQEGKGDFILFHGNLEVSENNKAALYLTRHIFSKINYKVVIAGRNPSKELRQTTRKHTNIKLVSSPSIEEMRTLIQEAHIHLLYTFQATGLKLKLLNSTFEGRHILTNEKMIRGTGLENLVHIAKQDHEIISQIKRLMQLEFTSVEIDRRNKLLQRHYSNIKNALTIGELL
jgi:glycosyltransferase involved in cell wall biosynthesis